MNEKQVIALLLNQSEIITGKFNNTINEILRLGYDTEIGDWQRTGIESSVRKIREYIICPLCKKEITIKEWEEDF